MPAFELTPACEVKSGPYKGMTFPEYLEKAGKTALGTLGQKFDCFPVKIKLIDADGNAQKQEGQTRLSVVLESEPGDCVYRGPDREAADLGAHLYQCPYFTVDRREGTFTGLCGKDSFHVLLVVDGGATLYCDGEHKTMNKGGYFFLPAGCGYFRVEGNCELLEVYLSDTNIP